MADRMIECPRCNGLSRNDGTASLSCSRCGSSGTIPDRRKPSEIEDALRAEVARQIKENESLAEANLTYAMETKELRDEVERLKVAEGEAMLVVESQDVSVANLRAEVAALREQRDHKFEQFLDWRGIEVGEQCDRCQGAGSYMYSSTATWMGGIGGQAMTVGVCNKCWGSGKKNSPWTNLRDVMQIRREIAALKDERDECALGVMTASERAGRYANQIASLKAAKARAAEAFPAVIPFIGADDDGYACNAAMEVLSAYFAEEAGDD